MFFHLQAIWISSFTAFINLIDLSHQPSGVNHSHIVTVCMCACIYHTLCLTDIISFSCLLLLKLSLKNLVKTKAHMVSFQFRRHAWLFFSRLPAASLSTCSNLRVKNVVITQKMSTKGKKKHKHVSWKHNIPCLPKEGGFVV